MALNELGNKVMGEITALFSLPRGSASASRGSKHKKKARREATVASSYEEEMPAESEAESGQLFSDEQTEWLGSTMG